MEGSEKPESWGAQRWMQVRPFSRPQVPAGGTARTGYEAKRWTPRGIVGMLDHDF